MVKKEPKRLPRGFWDSSEGRVLINKVRRREITVQDLGKQLGISDGAIYNAMSKRALIQAPVPIEHDPALDQLLASAEQFLGDVVTMRLKALQKELTEMRTRAETAERELEVYRNKVTDQASMVDSLQRRIAARIAHTEEAIRRDD